MTALFIEWHEFPASQAPCLCICYHLCTVYYLLLWNRLPPNLVTYSIKHLFPSFCGLETQVQLRHVSLALGLSWGHRRPQLCTYLKVRVKWEIYFQVDLHDCWQALVLHGFFTEGLSSSPCFLASTGLLTICQFSPLVQDIWWRGRETEKESTQDVPQSLYNLILKVISHHFCTILLIRKDLFSTIYTVGGGDNTRMWMSGSGDHLGPPWSLPVTHIVSLLPHDLRLIDPSGYWPCSKWTLKFFKNLPHPNIHPKLFGTVPQFYIGEIKPHPSIVKIYF